MYKRHIIETAIFILTFGFWIGLILSAIQNQFDVPSIEAKQYHKWVEKHQPIIIDVRESVEVQQDPINYHPVIHLPFLFIHDRLDSITVPQDQEILFVCSDGNRARLIASLLAKRGVDSHYLSSGLQWVKDR
jgi:rhodanese-related sulfurtransferase